MRAHGSGRGPRRRSFWLLALAVLLIAPAAPAKENVRAFPAMLPTLRLRLGPATHLTGAAAAETAPAVRQGTGFALDLALGYPVWLFLRRQNQLEVHSDLNAPTLVIHPELSYSYEASGRHGFTAGGHFGAGMLWAYASYGVRFVAGDDQGQRMLGLRHGIGAHFLVDLISIELNHQPLWVAGQLQHDLIFWVSLNPLSTVGALMAF
jgi:hypothetical protein